MPTKGSDFWIPYVSIILSNHSIQAILSSSVSDPLALVVAENKTMEDAVCDTHVRKGLV